MAERHDWPEIKAKLNSNGVDTGRTFDFSGTPVYHGENHAYNLPLNGSPEPDLAPGTYSMNGGLYRVTGHDGNVMIGNAGGEYTKIRNTLEGMGFKERGSVPFTAGQLTGTVDAEKLAAVRGVGKEWALSPKFEGSAFRASKWVTQTGKASGAVKEGGLLTEAAEIASKVSKVRF